MPAVADKVTTIAAKHVQAAAKHVARPASTSIVGGSLETTRGALGNAQMLLIGLPILSAILGFIGKAPFIGGVFRKASEAVGAPAKFADANTVESALNQAHTKISGLVGDGKLNKIGKLVTHATGSAEKVASKADVYIKGTSKAFDFAKNKITAGAASVKGMKVSEAVWKGGVHVGNAALAYQNIKTTSSGIDALKDMCQDLSPQAARPSTFQILFGNVPECVKEMRSQFIKTSIIRSISDIIGIVVSTKLTSNNVSGKKMVLGIGLQMGTGAISSFIGKGNDSAALYAAMKDMQAENKALPAELIAQFIGSADKNLRAAGGPEEKVCIILSQKYAAEALSAEAILAKVNSNAITQDRANLKSLQVDQSRGKSNLHTMPSPAAAAPGKAIVGAHTNRHVQQMGKPFMMAGGRAA